MTDNRSQRALTALAAMDPESFAALVRDSLGRDADTTIWDALTSPEVIHRTRGCLGALRSDIQGQLSQANADLEEIRGGCLDRGENGRREFLTARSAQAEWRRRAAGAGMIAAERLRQMDAEGWTPEHDAHHTGGELAIAAACYALPQRERTTSPGLPYPRGWPWGVRAWKPDPGDRLRELAKAGALIAAEIDRLLTAPPAFPVTHTGTDDGAGRTHTGRREDCWHPDCEAAEAEEGERP